MIFVAALSSLSFGPCILTNRSKKSAKIWISSGIKTKKYKLSETDSTLTLTTTDSTTNGVIISCSFKKDNCVAQKIAFDCDACYRETMKIMLDKKRFKWKQVGPDRYLSKASRKLLLAGNSAEKYVTLTMLTMSDDEYKKLLAK